MKIIDSNTLEDNLIRADICIVGAGPAGITLAAKLADSNLDTILIESGGTHYDELSNKLNTLKVKSNFNYEDEKRRRNRQIGGTANFWVGRVVPYQFDSELDSEWGGLKNEITNYYDVAFRLFGLQPDRMAQVTDTDQTLTAYWAHNTERFNYKSRLIQKTGDVRVYSNMTCIGEPVIEPDHRIKKLSFLNKNRDKFQIQSRVFVFAMGGIENTRMLLILKEQLGIKSGDLLKNAGKYMMDHPRIWHGIVHSKPGSSALEKFQIKTSDWGLYKKGIRNRPDNIRIYSNLMKPVSRAFSYLDRMQLGWLRSSSKWLINREKGFLRMLSNEICRLPGIRQSEIITSKLQNFFNSGRSEMYNLMTYCEQMPRLENQMVLTLENDRYGMRKPELNNDLYSNEIEQVLVFFNTLEKKFKELGCTLEYDKEFLADANHYTDASHNIGGTRYSADEEKAVVDKSLSVIGMPNLYITGSSVFPRGGVENPTHLIVCLSCYLADELISEFDKVR